MTSFEDLPPDRRAVLSLLLRQRKSCDEVAAALRIAPGAVHDRAHAALAVLAPQKARALDADTRERVGEYLLGRQQETQAQATKAMLAQSPPAREWARALAVELVKLAAEPLPEIPAGPASTEPASTEPASTEPASTEPASTGLAPAEAPPAVSRRSGALLLAGIALVAVIAIAVILSSGGSGNSANQAASHTREASTSKQETSTGPSRAGSRKSPKLEEAAELKPVQPGGSAKGAALIASEGSKRGLYLSADGLAASNGFSYVVWLIHKDGRTTAFGRTPSVGSDGRVTAVELLTDDPRSLTGVEITRETAAHPGSPGTVVLRGHFVGG